MERWDRLYPWKRWSQAEKDAAGGGGYWDLSGSVGVEEGLRVLEARGGVVGLDLSWYRGDTTLLESLLEDGWEGLCCLRLRGWRMDDGVKGVLRRLKRLRMLDLSQTRWGGDFRPLAGACVEEMELAWASMYPGGLQGVEGLPRLKRLGLRGNKLTGAALHPLEGSAGLESLDISYNPLRDDAVVILSKLVGLRKLWASATEIRLEGWEQAVGWPLLEVLHLDQHRVGGESVAWVTKCPNLQELSWQATEVGDRELRWLCGLRRLERLYLSDTRATTEGMRSVSLLSGLKELTLARTACDDLALWLLSGLTGLTHLSLQGTIIRSEGLRHLALLHRLQELRLGQTAVDDTAIPWLRRLQWLRFLEMEDTELTEEGLIGLISMPRLEKLALLGTSISEEARQRFRIASPHCALLS